MKKLTLFVISLFFFSHSYGQKGINSIGEYVNNNCDNCNQSQLNNYVLKLCNESDSIIKSTMARFSSKLNGSNFEVSIKKKIKSRYHNTYKNLIETRDNVIKNFSKQNTPSTLNDYNRGLLYLFLDENIISVLNFIETNQFGDFYVLPPRW